VTPAAEAAWFCCFPEICRCFSAINAKNGPIPAHSALVARDPSRLLKVLDWPAPTSDSGAWTADAPAGGLLAGWPLDPGSQGWEQAAGLVPWLDECIFYRGVFRRWNGPVQDLMPVQSKLLLVPDLDFSNRKSAARSASKELSNAIAARIVLSLAGIVKLKPDAGINNHCNSSRSCFS